MSILSKLKKSQIIKWKNNYYFIIDVCQQKKGRQIALYKLVVKNLNNNSITNLNLRSISLEKIEFVFTKTKKLEFMYSDQFGYHFCDQENYEEYILSESIVIEEKKCFLIHNHVYDVLFADRMPFVLKIPNILPVTVIDVNTEIKGNTVSNAHKSIVANNNLIIKKVPLFINKGDIINISTQKKEYINRQ